jgi:Zn-dependent protease with chaperone function/ribosomal protein S27E
MSIQESPAGDFVTLRCRYCGRNNRVLAARQASARCGGCKRPFDATRGTPQETGERRRLKGLSSLDYEHPIDRKALVALQNTRGLDLAVRKFNEYGLDRLMKVECVGSNLRVNRTNFPEIHATFREACRILDVAQPPMLYVEYADAINAFTAGVEQPLVCLSTAAVDGLTTEELLFLMGHELGHIKSSHVLYHQMARVLPYIGDAIGMVTINFGKLLTLGLESALLYWHRMSEYTADRAGLLCCQEVGPAITTLIKTAGLPQKHYEAIDIDDFLLQAREFEGDQQDVWGLIARTLSLRGKQHPWTVVRAAELTKWIDAGDYGKIVDRYG